jgi:elongation factor Ts
LAKTLLSTLPAFDPKYLHRDQVPADVIEMQRRIAEETAREEGKPEAAMAKIIEGRVAGFVKEVSLMAEQSFAKDAEEEDGEADSR